MPNAASPAAPTSANLSAEREVTITRVIAAPPRLVFAAYTAPEHLKQWFGPPGFPLTLCEMDFRAGGAFRFAMTGADGVQGPPFGGTYREIVAGKRIVYTNGFFAVPPGMPPDLAGEMLVTITFEDAGAGKTRLDIHTLFETVTMARAHLGLGYEQGVDASLPQLEAVARALAAKGDA